MHPSTPTQPWPDIAAAFDALARERGPSFEPMRALVQFLAASRYANELFARAAADDLHLGRSRDFAPGDNELRIRFDSKAQRFTFAHVRRPAEPDPWSRDCAAAQWQAALERLFHKRLQWFHEG